MEYGVYGNTWWSKKWLDSVLRKASARDFEKAFALLSKGNLVSFEIQDNRVMSTVKGPAGGTHNTYTVFKKFDDAKAEVFISLLRQQPAELAALNNGSLSQSIEILLDRCNLELFDLADSVNMNCDCKDPLPCRYIVATLLKVGQMMGEDPFLIFKLHGLDLKGLKDAEIDVGETDVPKEPGMVRPLPRPREELPPRLPEFKFDEWRDYSHVLPAMLTNCPDFAGGNFKKSFVDELEQCRSTFVYCGDFKHFVEDFSTQKNTTFLMNKERLRLIHSRGWRFRFEQLDDERVVGSNLTADDIMIALCKLNQECVWSNHITVRYLHLLLQVAFHLVRCAAVYPQVFWISSNTAQIRWLPAEMLPEVLAVVTELEKWVPADFAYTQENGERTEFADAAEHVLSLFIGRLLRYGRPRVEGRKILHGNLLGFFFNGASGTLSAANLQIPEKIQNWFSVYSKLNFDTRMRFVCNEVGREIAMDVFVVDGDRLVHLAELFRNSDSRLLSLMNILNCVAENFAPMKAYLANRAESPIMLYGRQLNDFLTSSIKKFEVFGIVTELPPSLLNIQRPKSQMKLNGSFGKAAGANVFTKTDIMDFDWEVAIGNENVSAEEFLKLAEEAGGMLKYKSMYVQVTEDDLKLLKQRVDEREAAGSEDENDEEESRPTQFTTAKLVQACLTGKCDEVPVTMTDGLKKQLDDWRSETNISLPENLHATLRPYQERGYSWMYKNLQIGFGCILADDMGLGKTLQVIAFILKVKQEGLFESGRCLVVVPAGLLCNWQMEIKKFAPDLTVFAYHGASRNLEKFDADILITTYSTYRLDYKKISALNWQIVVIDEAQNIKNADSEQSRLLRRLSAPMKIAMSGTPVENRLMEFWTIMDFCNRGFFPSPTQFRDRYETPIQKRGDAIVAEQFKKLTAPFMLRRMKTDKSIISDLPDKIQQDEYAELTRTQAALYKTTLDRFLLELQTLGGEPTIDINGDTTGTVTDFALDSTADAVALDESVEAAVSLDSAATMEAADKLGGRTLFKRKGIILQMILALKQICNHPRTFLKEGVAEVDDSGKLRMLLDLLEAIQEQGEKTLIFTQFREMGEVLQEVIDRELKIKADFYHGGCGQSQRNNMVKNFQEDPEKKILILSLKAAGTGLNLTAASQVIHYDLWWNPAIEAQATDRAFRIGQTKNVQVHRFITKGTFEEKINALLESKKAIAEMTVNTGET
ncbi:MAG: SNF2-related protein, partial [Fibrobacter sp.]|nr:SNF2-related protein [Fibrobacter sp.]